jgi:hypothetical protein
MGFRYLLARRSSLLVCRWVLVLRLRLSVVLVDCCAYHGTCGGQARAILRMWEDRQAGMVEARL